MTANKRVSITPQTKISLEDIATDLDLTLGQTVEYLIDNYHKQGSKKSSGNNKFPVKNFTESEQKEIETAIKNTQSDLETIVKDGTLQRVRYLNSIAVNQAQLDNMSDDELKNSTFKGVAYHRINQAIEAIKEHNDKQGEKKDKVCLTRGIIFKLTGSNRQTINKFFDTYHIMIDDHNQKHNLTDSDNRKGKGFNFQELLGL